MTRFVVAFEEYGVETRLDLSDFVLNVSSCGILITGAAAHDCPILYANPAFLAMSGYPAGEVLGRNCRFLQNADREQPQIDQVRRGIDEQQVVKVELRNYRKDGSMFWCELTVAPFRDRAGVVTHFVGMQSDITARKIAEQALVSRISHDPMTGLPNQAVLFERFDAMLQTATGLGSTLLVATLQIDQFSRIRNALRRDSLDFISRTIASRIQDQLGEHDLVARNPTGNFSIVARIDNRNAAMLQCERIQRAVSAPIALVDEANTIHVSCSIGVALSAGASASVDSLINDAELALSDARKSGRSAILLCSEELTLRMRQQSTVEAALRLALVNGELAVYYQPQIDLVSGRIAGVEALVRWHHPVMGEVPPVMFIPIAEDTGLIMQIGAWVIQQALNDLASRRALGLTIVPVAINVSPIQFRDPQLADMIATMMARAQIDPAMVVLEITEAVLMEDTATSQHVLTRLDAMGVGLALDDFGTGYSSLSYLKRFAFKKVKIDRAFIDNIVDDPEDAAIVKAIIYMSHSLGITVIAEGVETEAQCQFLTQNMCDELQGFLFSKAVPPDMLNALLREDARLPQHLLIQGAPKRTLLLVDDEVNIVASLRRLFRLDGYKILSANSGAEGLEILQNHPVDVILSDQRMPGMTGVEFLSTAKKSYPDTVRLVLSGYTELKSVTDAVNEGAIYKFLTKPWDDAKLRGHVQEAFLRKELADENRRLTREILSVNRDLASANRQLQGLLDLKQQQLVRDTNSLEIVREALQHVPIAVIGIDDLDLIAFVNDRAEHLLRDRGELLGGDARDLLPECMAASMAPAPSGGARTGSVVIDGHAFALCSHAMGFQSRSRGRLIMLTPVHLLALGTP